ASTWSSASTICSPRPSGAGSSSKWGPAPRPCFFFSGRRRYTILQGDWSSDVCSSDLEKWNYEIDGPISNRHRAGRAGLQSRLAEIGRASCRERVEGPGAGGALKEKNEERGRGGGTVLHEPRRGLPQWNDIQGSRVIRS